MVLACFLFFCHCIRIKKKGIECLTRWPVYVDLFLQGHSTFSLFQGCYLWPWKVFSGSALVICHCIRMSNPVASLCRSVSSRPLHLLLVSRLLVVALKGVQWECVSVINWLLLSDKIHFLSVKQTCWEPHLVITHFHGHSLVVVVLMWLDEVLGSIKTSLNIERLGSWLRVRLLPRLSK